MRLPALPPGQLKHPCNFSQIKSQWRFLFLFFSLFLFVYSAHAQSTVTVKGMVTRQNGEPLSGVSVIVKGTEKGVATQNDGSFQLEANVNSTLVISYVGFIRQEIKLGTANQPNLSIQLLEDKNELNQVVVVGYGTRKKSDVTGAIVSISEQSIKEIPAANLTQAIQGQGAGIDIQKNGGNSKPGATPTILIRGSRSISATNEPLIVVDGIPFNGSINDLNQDDVASVEILKDASATAIYGSRGANGVVLITTKRGRSGKPVITYNAYVGKVSILKEYPVMNTQEFSEFKKWALYNGRYTGNNRTYSSPNDSALILQNFSPEELQSMKTGRSTDWQKLIYKDGIITDHQLGYSGGTDITQYALSAGYFKETGIYYGQAFERFSLKASVDQQFGKRVKVGISSLNTYTITDGEGANPMGQALRASPLVSPYNTDGTLLNDFVPGSASQVWNPLANFLIPGASVQKRKRFGTFTTLYADINIIDGLKYRFNSGVELRSDIYGEFYASKTTNNLGGLSTAQNRTNFRTNYTLENILTYDKVFAKKHKINFTGLFSLQEQSTQGNEFRNNTIAADDLQYYNPTYGANLVGEGTEEKWDILSYMGRLNYSYDDRYLLTLTMRTDASSRLAPGNKDNLFPSAAIGWNMHRESFLSNVRAISSLRLRASYGRVGNTAISAYQTLGALTAIVYNYGDATTTGVFISNVPNPDLTWEYTSTFNAGLDFGLLNNRISGSLEFYKQSTDNLLLPQTLPATSGIPNAIVTNVGKTENKGIELHVSTVNLLGRTRNNFSWTTDFNFFINRGKITQLAGGVLNDPANSRFVGSPIGVFFDWKKIGIWQATAADSALAVQLGQTVNGVGTVIGNIKREDISGPNGKPDGKLTDTYDRIILGSSQPKWEGGMTNRFSYRGFDLTVVAFARWGHMIRSNLHGGGFVNTFQGTYNNIKTRYWTPTNGENEYPKPNANNTNTPNNSLLGYFDGSFVKIRTISLGYNLSPPMLKRWGMRSVRVYTTVEDPFILFSPFVNKYGGIDPEASGGTSNPGVATLNLDTPSNWSIIFGINISL
ncbi:MAG TPA: TonB-dependent receptor [Chitinophagaceae bacterium]|nr:TonB-dependent receptor [Chitinophagaceae bacterium]